MFVLCVFFKLFIYIHHLYKRSYLIYIYSAFLYHRCLQSELKDSLYKILSL